MKIFQMYFEVKYGDAISSIMYQLHKINIELNYVDTMFAYFSELPEVKQVALAQISKSQMLYKFLKSKNKLINLRKYLSSNVNKATCEEIQKTINDYDVRIWHMGTYYDMQKYMHKNDILFFYGLNYPYLSSVPDAIIHSYLSLNWIKALEPFVIVESQEVKNELLRFGYPESKIHILPLFHTYSIKLNKIKRSTHKPILLSYGRYAINKRIPEIAEMCSKAKIGLITFGDNTKTVEFVEEYTKANKFASNEIKLFGKMDKREDFYSLTNIYICNSENEGFCMPVVESMAWGMPQLVRRGTAAEELITNGKDGFLYSNINEVPKLIKKIMKDYNYFSYNAWKHSQNYNYKKFKQNYLKILKNYTGIR